MIKGESKLILKYHILLFLFFIICSQVVSFVLKNNKEKDINNTNQINFKEATYLKEENINKHRNNINLIREKRKYTNIHGSFNDIENTLKLKESKNKSNYIYKKLKEISKEKSNETNFNIKDKFMDSHKKFLRKLEEEEVFVPVDDNGGTGTTDSDCESGKYLDYQKYTTTEEKVCVEVEDHYVVKVNNNIAYVVSGDNCLLVQKFLKIEEDGTKTCVDSCSHIQSIDDDILCVESCTATQYSYQKWCIDPCQNSGEGRLQITGSCISCSDIGLVLLNGRCVDCFNEGMEKININGTDKCAKICNENYERVGEECVLKENTNNNDNNNNNENVNAKCKNKWYRNNAIENPIICVEECPEEYMYFNVSSNECLNSCEINMIFDGQCSSIGKKGNEKTRSKVEELMKDDPSGFVEKIKEKDEGMVVNNGDSVFQATTSDNPKTPHISSISLGDCESKLKTIHSIPEDMPLIILKMDIYDESRISPDIEFEVLNPVNGNKLNIKECNNNIVVDVPLKIDEEKEKYVKIAEDMGYDVFNSSSDFYTSICTQFTSPDNTDISLSKRKEEFLKESSVCGKGCTYSGYNTEFGSVECECEPKENLNVQEVVTEIGNVKSLIENSNLMVTKCVSLVFNKNIVKNYGSLIMSSASSIIVISTIIYIVRGTKGIQNIVDNIFNIGKNNNKFNNNIDGNNKQTNINNNNSNPPKKGVKCVKINDSNLSNEVIPVRSPKKRKKKKLIKGIKRLDNTVISETSDNSKKVLGIFDKTKKTEAIVSSSTSNILMSNDGLKHYTPNKLVLIHNNLDEKGDYIEKDKDTERKGDIGLTTKNESGIIIPSFSYPKEYDFLDLELNNLTLEEAIIYDKRTFCQYYWTVIKYNHLLIFTFFINNDFNIMMIKIILFFICFMMFFAFNALFFTDETMNKIYIEKGRFDFFYNLPKIIFSSVCTKVIDFLLRILSLSHIDIIVLKKEIQLNYQATKEKANKLIRCIKIKTIFFTIFTWILMFLFWYYISSFCAVYKNTQWHLIKDTLFSFALNLIIPFGIAFIPAILRFISLKMKYKCLYCVSKLLQ